jgi:hypothetical protein
MIVGGKLESKNDMQINYTEIESYSKCSCGAVTIHFTNGAYNSMSGRTQRMLGINLRKIKRLPESCACDHCVNHWGIDLCECGSGKAVGKCNCGSSKSVMTFGKKYDSFSKMLQNFGML